MIEQVFVKNMQSCFAQTFYCTLWDDTVMQKEKKFSQQLPWSNVSSKNDRISFVQNMIRSLFGQNITPYEPLLVLYRSLRCSLSYVSNFGMHRICFGLFLTKLYIQTYNFTLFHCFFFSRRTQIIPSTRWFCIHFPFVIAFSFLLSLLFPISFS